jgi:hypothetical protein
VSELRCNKRRASCIHFKKTWASGISQSSFAITASDEIKSKSQSIFLHMATEEETTQGVFFRVELELGKERKVHFWLRER